MPGPTAWSTRPRARRRLGQLGHRFGQRRGRRDVHVAAGGGPGGASGPGAVFGVRQPGGAAVRDHARLPGPGRGRHRAGCDRAEHRPGHAGLPVRRGPGRPAGLGLLQRRDRLRGGTAAGRARRDRDRVAGPGAGGVPARGDRSHRVRHERGPGRGGDRGYGGADRVVDHPGGDHRPGRQPADRGARRGAGVDHPAVRRSRETHTQRARRSDVRRRGWSRRDHHPWG